MAFRSDAIDEILTLVSDNSGGSSWSKTGASFAASCDYGSGDSSYISTTSLTPDSVYFNIDTPTASMLNTFSTIYVRAKYSGNLRYLRATFETYTGSSLGARDSITINTTSPADYYETELDTVINLTSFGTNPVLSIGRYTVVSWSAGEVFIYEFAIETETMGMAWNQSNASYTNTDVDWDYFGYQNTSITTMSPTFPTPPSSPLNIIWISDDY